MPSIKDNSTVEAIAREFTSNGRNKERAMRTIGYAESSCKSGKAVKDVYGNLRVKQAIARIDAKTSEKIEHNQEIAIKKLYADYENLETAALRGNIAAIQARTAIIRELNEITGQHKKIFIDKTPQQRELDESQALLADEFIAWKQRKRLKGAG